MTDADADVAPFTSTIAMPELIDKVGSVLLASPRPVEAGRLAAALEAPVEDVLAAITALTEIFGRGGGEVQATPGGYRLVTKPDNAEVVRAFQAIPKRKKLSQEALETLVMIMREGPVTGPEIGRVRRVQNLRGTLDTLIDEGLVETAGRRKERGAPRLYRATQAAQDRFGAAVGLRSPVGARK